MNRDDYVKVPSLELCRILWLDATYPNAAKAIKRYVARNNLDWLQTKTGWVVPRHVVDGGHTGGDGA